MKILKWIGIILGGLILILALAAGGMFISTTSRFNKTYDITPESLSVAIADGDLAVGEHWAEIHCRACHGEDLGGGPFFEDPSIGYVDAPNLTTGEGGIGTEMTDADWVLAIRHGVKHDGTSVFIMPSNDFYYLSDGDLAGIIAYVKSVPAVDREIREPLFKPFAKILYALGAFGDLLYAETIQHDVRPPSPAVGMTLEYGEYLVNAHGCKTCHGDALSGKQPAEPGAPLAPNLTPGGELAVWTEADFMNTIRTGVTPSGHELSESMPWKGLGKMTDDELKTVWMFLQTQPALETTTE
jgi:mono/diheme cytochrome c family protein